MTFEGYPGHGGFYEPAPISDDEPHQPAMTAVPLSVAVARRIAERKAEAEAQAERERQEAKAQEQREQAAAAAIVDWLRENEGIITEFEDWQAEEIKRPQSDNLGLYRFTYQPWDPFWRPVDEYASLRYIQTTYVWQFAPGEAEDSPGQLTPTSIGNSTAPKWSVWQPYGPDCHWEDHTRFVDAYIAVTELGS